MTYKKDTCHFAHPREVNQIYLQHKEVIKTSTTLVYAKVQPFLKIEK